MSSLFSPKTKTTSASSNPAWVDIAGQEGIGLAKQALFGGSGNPGGVNLKNAKPFQAYSGQRVANLSPDINAASTMANNASGMWDQYFGGAKDNISKSTAGFGQTFDSAPITYTGWDAGQRDAYMNPYVNSVVSDMTDEMLRASAVEKARNSSLFNKSGAFGGSRHGVADGEIARGTIDKVGQNTRAALNDAYGFAMQAFQNDQGRKLQTDSTNEDNRFRAFDVNRQQFNTERERELAAAKALESLATSRSNITSQDVDRLLKTGALKTDQVQKKLDTAYQDFVEKRDYDKNNIEWLMNLLSSNPSRGAIQTTTSQTGSILGQIAGMASAAAGVAGGGGKKPTT